MTETLETQSDSLFASLREQLAADDMSIRMKAVHASRSLPLSQRFDLLSIAAIDSNARIRYDVISQLGTVGTVNLDKSLEILSDRLSADPELDVRAAAAASLGSLQLAQAFDLLKTSYETNHDWMFQFSIVAAMGELGAPQGLDFLAQVLQSSNELVKIAAIGSLGDLGNPQAVDLLTPFINDPDWQIRHRVVQSLAQLGGSEAQSALQKLANDPMPQVAEAARSQL